MPSEYDRGFKHAGIFAIIITVIAAPITSCCSFFQGRDMGKREMRREAVRRGYGYFDENAIFQWREHDDNIHSNGKRAGM